MFETLESIEQRYEEITEMMSDPEIINDTERFMALSKEEGELRETVAKFREYREVKEELEGTKEILDDSSIDAEMKELAQMENDELAEKEQALEGELQILLLPKDENDDKNIIMEIRGAAGGDEAQIFAADLLRMYTHYADKQGWKVDLMSASQNDVGGYKEVTLMIEGSSVYSRLKFENGAHRVQRVPETESQGRVHTSTATVVVMPEAEEVDFDLDMNDVRIDIFRASGAGGQHVNVTDSAVRMTHDPTGIVVSMQDERSQIKNREKAERLLRARVADHYQSEAQAEYDATRKTAVGTGDRSERIRTYNYPQSRMTDHRINYTSSRLESIMNGELDEIIDQLILVEQQEKMEQFQHGL
ncbi:MAG: peptide chain release factor 1 [Atopococcus tabaci]|uniref:Peptide chain release factor 1 n=1 Tax=Atopococcus tabaci TaxID=269774 RepID=A0AA43ZS50_9LACT|nr:peptide chain release factor 1 [Atopococcus tabaci]